MPYVLFPIPYSIGRVSAVAGVTVRTLHHYDRTGLLSPGARSTGGYRLSDDAGLARLRQILPTANRASSWTRSAPSRGIRRRHPRSRPLPGAERGVGAPSRNAETVAANRSASSSHG